MSKIKSQNQNSKLKTLYFLFLFFIFYYLFFNLSEAKAQSVSLGISPGLLEVMIQPGKSITQVYKITNNGDPVIVNSNITAFVAEEDNGKPILVECAKVEVIGCESISWFESQNAILPLRQAFFLQGGKTQEIVLKITVPDYANEGDYYNSLVFSTQAPPQDTETATRATISIVSNILIAISKDGKPNRSIAVSDFSAKNYVHLFGKKISFPVFDSFEKIPVNVKITNEGKSYTKVTGKINLSGFPGPEKTFAISPTNILAGKSRVLLATPSANVNEFVLPQAFYLGRYQLQLNLENEDGQKISAKTYLFCLPYKIGFQILLVITVLVIVIKLVKKII